METYDATIEKSRYPGVSPFSESQQNIFFGRDSDIQNLTQLIQVRKQVLLYAKSGVGKTSLLMAGVLPPLRNKYVPLKIRFTAYTETSDSTPAQAVISALPADSVASETLLDKINRNTNSPKTLWYHFKQQQLVNPKTVFLLVFDQFEELFTYPENQINDFKQQLYDMIHSEVPGEIIDFLSEVNELTADRDINILYQEPEVKIIYAIRSDRLNLLNQLTDKIPDIQRDFYELKPLDNKQARAAIEGPAGKEGDFTVPPYAFPEELLINILDQLTQQGRDHLETTQLQIVCQRIEENISRKKPAVPENHGKLAVEKQDIPDFRDIFYEFYKDAIQLLSEDYQAKAHLLIENRLIINRRRISLDGLLCTEFLPENELQKLVKAHLLRAEPNNMGGFNYELSHDTLVDPINDVAEKRRLKLKEETEEKERQEELRKAREKAEQERAEREKETKRQAELLAVQLARATEAETAAEKQRKLKKFNILFVILFAIATALSCWKWIEADRNRNTAEKNERVMDSLLTNIIVIEYNRYLQNASDLADKGDFGNAIDELDKAKVIASDDQSKIRQIEDQKRMYYAKTDNENKYRELMTKAKSYEQTEALWPEAVKVYKEALLLNLHTDSIQRKLLARTDAILRRLTEYRQWTENGIRGNDQYKMEAVIQPALKLCSPDQFRTFYDYFMQRKNEIENRVEVQQQSKQEFLPPREGSWIIVFAADKDLDQAMYTNKNLKRAGITEATILLKDEQFFNISGEFPNMEEASLLLKKIGPRVRSDAYVVPSEKFCPRRIPRGAFLMCE